MRFLQKTRYLSIGIFFLLLVMHIDCMSPSVRFTRSGSAESGKKKSKPVKKRYSSTRGVRGSVCSGVAARYLGIPYKYGGMSRKGTDCSGLVCMIYKELAKVQLPHSSREQHNLGKAVGIRSARCGDLVFFSSRVLGRINHVGMYLGDNRFIHASRKNGVEYETLDTPYYKKRFIAIKRIIK